MSRGILTEEIKAKSLELLGYEICVRELRLMPYIDYTLKNSKWLDNINEEERLIVVKWSEAGFLLGTSMAKLSVTREFYNIIQELLWLGYVAYD